MSVHPTFGPGPQMQTWGRVQELAGLPVMLRLAAAPLGFGNGEAFDEHQAGLYQPGRQPFQQGAVQEVGNHNTGKRARGQAGVGDFQIGFECPDVEVLSSGLGTDKLEGYPAALEQDDRVPSPGQKKSISSGSPSQVQHRPIWQLMGKSSYYLCRLGDGKLGEVMGIPIFGHGRETRPDYSGLC